MPRTVRISFPNLPPRPRQLSASELSQVFGGCAIINVSCSKDADCCEPWKCLEDSDSLTGRRCESD
jgi:hypothetical protein